MIFVIRLPEIVQDYSVITTCTPYLKLDNHDHFPWISKKLSRMIQKFVIYLEIPIKPDNPYRNLHVEVWENQVLTFSGHKTSCSSKAWPFCRVRIQPPHHLPLSSCTISRYPGSSGSNKCYLIRATTSSFITLKLITVIGDKSGKPQVVAKTWSLEARSQTFLFFRQIRGIFCSPLVLSLPDFFR